jgi:hypothetical protein
VNVTRRALLAAPLIGLIVALLGAQSARADDPTLYVHYTMNCTFTIVGDDGRAISVIPPGNYQVLVTSPLPFAEPDLSGVADPNIACSHSLSFRLTGPGVGLHTTLEDGDASSDQLQAAFQVGTYVAQEDRRPAVTRTVITVSSGASSTGGGTSGGASGGSSGSPSNPKPSTGSGAGSGLAFHGWLNGNVSTAGALTLKFKGKAVSKLKAGRYRITVVDRAPRSSFSLQRVGKPAVTVTGLPFVGKRTMTLNLSEGRWMFYSALNKKRFFVVT